MKETHYLILIFLFLGWNTTQSQTIDTLVNVGNHSLHFKILRGDGTPILFESGNGDDGNVWESILQPIYDKTGATLITYDRAGLGQSGIDTTRISFKEEIEDLNKALKKLGFEENFFSVAHSFGGMYASEFAKEKDVKGAVFIDVSTSCNLDEEYTNRVRNSISDENWRMLKQYRTGLYYVLKNFPEIAEYMSERYISNSIPLTLIVAENYKPTSQIGETERDMQEWKTCLKDFGNQPNHSYVITEQTDHKVWMKDPKTVIDEIAKLYSKVAD